MIQYISAKGAHQKQVDFKVNRNLQTVFLFIETLYELI
jgi:hypothetical protein